MSGEKGSHGPQKAAMKGEVVVLASFTVAVKGARN